MERKNSIFILILFFLYCLIHPFILATAANNITTDQQALLSLKAHVKDDPTNFLAKNWNTTTSVCNWIGVTCDNIQNRVINLNLSDLNLAGSIPFEFGNLSSLQTLDLSSNQLFGTIPSSIFSMSSLQTLAFDYNNLSGELPPNICNSFRSLKSLYLRGNMFYGKIPSTLSKCKQLQHLWLPLNRFSGAIPKEIGNLTKLKTLHLGYNRLDGEIPQELGYFVELELLSLRNNFLTGTIPLSIFNLSSQLVIVDFAQNNLTGSLPNDMCHSLPFLHGLFMDYNHLTGRIPRGIGNCSSIEQIFLDFNDLTSDIPHEIGNLHNLEVLALDENNLIGVVPTPIFNISTMKELYLSNNTLTGSLPSSIDLGLPTIEILILSYNNFGGTIPSFILNSSSLTHLQMDMCSLSGFIPSTFGNLRNLKLLDLGYNYLTSSTLELSFLSSLTNCKNLQIIAFGGNPLNGILPSSIGNLSISLESIYMHDCNISGNIPEEIGNLVNLTFLNIEDNKFNGFIPVSLGKLQKLQVLDLANNKLEGSIPDIFCHFPALFWMSLAANKFSGSIPTCLGNLSTLREIYLDSNELTSNIPSTFWNLKDILSIDFSSNSLTGPLSLEIGNLKVVVQMNLSKNLFQGDIPTTIASLTDLQFLSLRYNRLTGSIPESFGDLTSLESLDLSSNNLSGVIPKSIEKLSCLKYLNVSFNRLVGEIPSGGPFANFSAECFVGNDLLCGSPNMQVPPCKSTKTSTRKKSKKNALLLGIVLPLSVAFILVPIFVLISRRGKRNTEFPNDVNVSPQATRRRFSYLELLRATDEFSESNLIGMGSFGSVYKARFQDGMEVAVKVFHLQFEGAFTSFDTECEVMKSIRHRNLVKIISSCSNHDFKALVLEYMPNGSLEKCLYSNNCNLDIFQRLNIMIDVASALEYLHFGYSIPVVHCDLKPSNVLLDENMVAHLTDFGIAKLLSGEDQSWTRTQTLATIGYMAPEYGREGKISIRGDVYSFGIMLMETFTKKKPTDELFAGEMSLKNWVNDLLHNSVIELVDANLLSREDRHFAVKEQCVSSILNLATKCTAESPKERINTKKIAPKLFKIRDILLRNIEGRRRIIISNVN